jgi:hypothetical protein
MKRIFLLLILSALFLANCKQTRDSNKISNSKIDTTIQRLKVIEDSISRSWNYMAKNEEDMFFNINRLLQEIEYIPGHDKVVVDSLRKANERAKTIRYTQETMKNSALIDQYDELSTALVDNVLRFAQSVKGLEKHQVAVELMDEIPQQFQKIYLNRVHYDFHIKDYNQLLNKNKKKLEKRDPAFKEAQPKPMFQLSSS